MRHSADHQYANMSLQLYTINDHRQPLIINHGDTEWCFALKF